MDKAVKRSDKLQEAKQRSKKKTSPPTKGLNEEIIDDKEFPPDQQAEINLLIEKYSREEMIEMIVESKCVIDKAELKNNPKYTPQSEETVRHELNKQDTEFLANLYIVKSEEVSEIHADDPKAPWHRRKA
jgi:hypothetical protein